MTQKELVIEFFKNNPNRNIEHKEIVPWLREEWKKRTGKPFRDPDRAIRKLHQVKFLIKTGKGIYRDDPKVAFMG